MTRSQETVPDNVGPQKLVIHGAQDSKGAGAFLPFGLDSNLAQQPEHKADPAAGLRAQVFAPRADGQAEKEKSKGRDDDNPALAAVVVGAVLQVKNGRPRQQFVVQQEIDGGRSVLLREDKIKNAVGPYTGSPDTVKKIEGTEDLYTDGSGVVVRQQGNRLERMYGYSVMSKAAIGDNSEIVLPEPKRDQIAQSTPDSLHHTRTTHGGTVIEEPNSGESRRWVDAPAYSNRYSPAEMRVMRTEVGEPFLVDPQGTVLMPVDGVLKVIPDVKVKKMGSDSEPASKYIDAGTGQLKLPRDRIIWSRDSRKSIQSEEGGDLLYAYPELAGASQPYTPEPGAVMTPITIDGKTYYKNIRSGTVAERQPDGSFRARVEFSLRWPYDAGLPGPGDIVIPGNPAQVRPARPERGESVGALGAGLPAETRLREGATLSAQDLNQMSTLIESLRDRKERTPEEVHELAALEMVHSQLQGDEKARVEFAERLAELRRGGLAGMAIIVTAALQWYATRNGKQAELATPAIIR